MTYTYNRRDLFEKADYEGGFSEFILGYGLRLEDVDPDDVLLVTAVKKVLDAAKPFEEALDELRQLEPESDDEYDGD